MQFGFMLKMEVLCALRCPKRTQKIPVPYLSKEVWLSIPPKFPTVALHRSKSSAPVHGGGRIETPGTCAFNIHSIYLSMYATYIMRREKCFINNP